MPAEELSAWIAEEPQARAALISRLSMMDMSSDKTLAARLLGDYGDDERVARAFFAAYISGSWWGPASSHWSQLAKALDTVVDRTTLAKLRTWAIDHARSLRKMAERDSQREEEQQLRGI
jgi:hypothetical protein